MIHNLIPILATISLIVAIEKRFSPRLDFSREDYLVLWYTDSTGKRVFKILF